MNEVFFMLRKVCVSIVLCVSIIASVMFPMKVEALSDDSISAPSAMLMEASTGKILFEKNSHERRPCASVTKVMTLLLVFEAIDSGKIDFDDMVTASEHAASMGGSDIWLETGESMSVDDMVKATVVASANDAAVALAEHICGSEDVFIEKMNERAKILGMKDTVFKNCNGLDEEGHLTSAYDVAVMSRELIKHDKVFHYTSIWLDNLRGGKTQIVNTNKLLKTYNGITGLKTGSTDDAGCCMSATAKRGNVSLISVVLGCNTGKERFADAAALLDYGFANILVKDLKLPDDLPKNVSVVDGMKKQVSLKCNVNDSLVIDKSKSAQLTSKIKLPKSIEAPILKNQKIGTISYYINDIEVKKYNITAIDSVEKTSFSTVLGVLFNSIIAL